MRIISKIDVENSLSMFEAIETIRQAFIELSKKTAIIPQRLHLSVEKSEATTLIMPAYLAVNDALACKIVSVFPANFCQNLPVINGLVVLLDEKNGKPLAILEGASLTALRTGAASGLATDLLARQEAKTLAVFGAGAQSATQIEGVCAVRSIEKVWVYDRRVENSERLVSKIQKKIDAEFFIAETPKQAVTDADIICTATTSETPVFDGNDLRDGVHINGVGSFKPNMREIDFTTLKKCSKIVVDSRENSLHEAGELVQAIEQNVINESSIYAEIGEIAAGLKAGRINENEITFFKSVGNAAQDALVSKAIYQLSMVKSFGIEVDF